MIWPLYVIIGIIVLTIFLGALHESTTYKCQNCGSVYKGSDLEEGKCPMCGSSAMKKI